LASPVRLRDALASPVTLSSRPARGSGQSSQLFHLLRGRTSSMPSRDSHPPSLDLPPLVLVVISSSSPSSMPTPEALASSCKLFLLCPEPPPSVGVRDPATSEPRHKDPGEIVASVRSSAEVVIQRSGRALRRLRQPRDPSDEICTGLEVQLESNEIAFVAISLARSRPDIAVLSSFLLLSWSSSSFPSPESKVFEAWLDLPRSSVAIFFGRLLLV